MQFTLFTYFQTSSKTFTSRFTSTSSAIEVATANALYTVLIYLLTSTYGQDA